MEHLQSLKIPDSMLEQELVASISLSATYYRHGVMSIYVPCHEEIKFRVVPSV